MQPVELTAPEGVSIAAHSGAGFSTSYENRMLVGMHVGCVYGFKAIGLPGYAGVELYPSVELIDRLYPPPGKDRRFPVPVELTQEDLRIAAQGGLVTRVIYVEDPKTALPVRQGKSRQWYEAKAGDNPLELADELGRPIAILRIGSRLAAPGGRFSSPTPLASEASLDRAITPASAALP